MRSQNVINLLKNKLKYAMKEKFDFTVYQKEHSRHEEGRRKKLFPSSHKTSQLWKIVIRITGRIELVERTKFPAIPK